MQAGMEAEVKRNYEKYIRLLDEKPTFALNFNY